MFNNVCNLNELTEVRKHGFLVFWRIPSHCLALDLFDASIDSYMLGVLSESLKHYPNLRGLNLARNRIDDEAARVLADSFTSHNLDELQYLYLGYNQFTELGLSTLMNSMQKHENLQRLALDHNNVRDIGFMQLMTLVETVPTLTHLDLEGCLIGFESEQQIASLSRSIDIRFTLPYRIDLDSLPADINSDYSLRRLNTSITDSSEIKGIDVLEDDPCSLIDFTQIRLMFESIGISEIKHLTEISQDEMIDLFGDATTGAKVKRCANAHHCIAKTATNVEKTRPGEESPAFQHVLSSCDGLFHGPSGVEFTTKVLDEDIFADPNAYFTPESDDVVMSEQASSHISEL